MKLIPKGRLRIKLQQTVWITLSWTVIAALDALNTQALSQSKYLESTDLYDFESYLLINIVAAFVSGILSGAILVFYLRDRFRLLPFGLTISLNTVLISLINFLVSALIFHLFFALQLQQNLLNQEVIGSTWSLVISGFYFKNFVLWFIVALMTIIMLNVNEKYGPGVLPKLLMGRYHHPREEERIIMFADIKSSTTIAEKLGHIQFFDLLNDFFHDLTNPIVDYGGEIYQYVGDEVVITWTMKNGLTNSNCIRSFYAMREAIQRQSHKYIERYGLVPEFKAGMHCGLVTIGEIGVMKKDIVFSGDVINTASRIQNLCNKFRVKILISKYLLEKLNLPPNDFQPKRMGIIELKGKRQKMELYTFEEHVDAEEEVRRPLISAT